MQLARKGEGEYSYETNCKMLVSKIGMEQTGKPKQQALRYPQRIIHMDNERQAR
jgi:hypothetical protein